MLGDIAYRHEAGAGSDGAADSGVLPLFYSGNWLGFHPDLQEKLPPVVMFRKPKWLILLVVTTDGVLGNFILLSSSLQYLGSTVSQVIAQLSPVGMMFASVVILKGRMRGPPVIGAVVWGYFLILA